MIPEELTQRTEAWWNVRAGKVTASRIGDLMATTRNGWGAARKRYFDEILSERLTGKSIIKRVASLDWRAELEPEARIAYEFYTDNSVREVGFIPHPEIENAGASPDGYVNDDGILEIKALDAINHVALLNGGPIDNAYLAQMQFGLTCSRRAWADFLAYNPQMPEELKVIIKRIERDDHAISKIESAVREFLAEINSQLAKILKASSA